MKRVRDLLLLLLKSSPMRIFQSRYILAVARFEVSDPAVGLLLLQVYHGGMRVSKCCDLGLVPLSLLDEQRLAPSLDCICISTCDVGPLFSLLPELLFLSKLCTLRSINSCSGV
jgi:hypothetical protein